MTNYETASLILTIVLCTWKLCAKLNTMVTHQVCKERRAHCPCRRDVEQIKKEIAK